jgi:hypothetical protein
VMSAGVLLSTGCDRVLLNFFCLEFAIAELSNAARHQLSFQSKTDANDDLHSSRLIRSHYLLTMINKTSAAIAGGRKLSALLKMLRAGPSARWGRLS